MNGDSIATIITSVFLLLIILGLVFGWWRGYAKSLVRLGMVIGVAVLTFFVVPEITKALLTIDISGLNIVIGENAATNLQELVIALLESIPYVSDLMMASPSFEAIIILVPEAILNLVGFILFFYIFRFVSMIIFWIINAIAFPKKKQEGKNKHRMVGAVIGAVQGAIIAIVLLLPVYGFLNVATPLVKEDGLMASNNAIVSEYVSAEEEGEDAIFKSSIATVEDYINAVENSFLTKVFKAVGVTKLADITFESLTTVKYEETEFNLKKEITTFGDAFKHASFIKNEKIDFTNPEHAEGIDAAIDVLLTSKNFSDIIGEAVVGVAEGWTNPEDPKFMGISKPDFKDEDLNAAFDKILLQLRDSRNKINKDIGSLSEAYKILAQSGILTSDDVIETMKEDKNDLLVTNVVNTLLESPVIKECLPDVLNCAFKFGYRAVGFTDEQITNIGDVNTDAVIDDNEVARIQNIADNAIIIYDKMNNSAADAKLYEKVDFTALGATFDNLRKSTLFGDISLKLVQEILKTEKFVGTGNASKFADLSTALADVWAKEDADLAGTFKAFGDAMKVADKLADKTESSVVTGDDVKDILGSLNNNENMGSVIETVVTDEFLKENLGMNDETADVVIDVVNKVVSAENFNVANETDAAVEIFNTASKIINSDGEVGLSDDEQRALVDALVQSDTITSLLAENVDKADKNNTLDLTQQLSDETLNDIKDIVDDLPEETAEDIAKKELIEKIFGITA